MPRALSQQFLRGLDDPVVDHQQGVIPRKWRQVGGAILETGTWPSVIRTSYRVDSPNFQTPGVVMVNDNTSFLIIINVQEPQGH